MDDIATLKVFATILLLPVLYLAIAIFVGLSFGPWWALVSVVGLSLSFFASIRLIEAEAGLLLSVLSVFKLARLGSEVEDLRATRMALVKEVRELVDRYIEPGTKRMFTQEDFGS
jgi:hypothetical protein